MQSSDIKELLNFNDEKLEIESEELTFFSGKLKELAGISLRTSKKELLRGRLRTRLHALNLHSFADYRRYLQGLSDEHQEWQSFINLLTTNKTDFFREPKHFDYLTHHFLPEWLKRSTEKTLKIWSCASSTGEEAYSLAMHLAELMPEGRDFHILSTDIDTKVIRTARNGVYSIEKWEQIPEELRLKYTDRGTEEIKGWFRINLELKKKVEFEQYNLIDPTLPHPAESYDLIFCRNVFIYFSKETITEVIEKLHSATKAQGLLFIGHSESIQNLPSKWESIRPAIYKRSRD